MDFNLETIITAATIVVGIIWLVDAVFFAKARRGRVVGQDAHAAEATTRTPAAGHRDPIVVEYAKSFFPVLLIVLLLRTFLVEPFHIPSSSMVPTLLVGDFILVNKFDYGLRLPVLHSKILPIGEPERGDVVVFRYPEKQARAFCGANPMCAETGGMQQVRSSAGVDYIKRVIGLPGDHVVYQDKTLYINGVRVPGKLLGPYGGPDVLGATLRQEKLGNVTHNILSIDGEVGPQGEWVVPPGEYLMMGDNRDDSFDSRSWGFVPEKDLVGRAFLVWMNWDAFHDPALWHRIGKVIH